ncbi:hypothetical protein SAMN05216203_0075 [Marinobacter daqiaonensis]|uniref:Alpha/beta hydrolase n=1 Tax=Marinobacter daqiaonensis TaxID=650891 RepID=A0A1I6GGM8_9GAMM|nr:hypothetical protein [Marinobacter daqiaonensis]SFR41336.1 hypothetical protein SAMN05216203_0075 [Marinobacter daqiaonensis]
MIKNKLTWAVTTATLSTFLLTGCGSDSDDNGPVTADPNLTREHSERTFTPAADISFTASANASAAYYGTYEGDRGPAVYSVEFPTDWNGGVVMYTHGYAGTGSTLPVTVPGDAWRETVLAAGYAWAASSYSANYYDVRAAIEDTNKLANEMMTYLEQDWSVQYDAPTQFLISGYSMGGHTAAAAVDRENMERTNYPVAYEGAAPFCQAEQYQFQWLGDYTRLAQAFAGYGYLPHSEFDELIGTFAGPFIATSGPIIQNLFNLEEDGTPDWSSPANINGERLMAAAEILSGGDRPIFEQGFATFYNDIVMGTGGRDGTINGILGLENYGNEGKVYRWTTADEPTAAELAFNEQVPRQSADPKANALRTDGVRWLPLVNGEFDVPVLTLHTLGDFYVPFKHQQLYRERAMENGNADLLVQRAIRDASHCGFSPVETQTALVDWLTWVNGGAKPAGDVVLDPAVVAAENYGCEYTSPDRTGLPACPSVGTAD